MFIAIFTCLVCSMQSCDKRLNCCFKIGVVLFTDAGVTFISIILYSYLCYAAVFRTRRPAPLVAPVALVACVTYFHMCVFFLRRCGRLANLRCVWCVAYTLRCVTLHTLRYMRRVRYGGWKRGRGVRMHRFQACLLVAMKIALSAVHCWHANPCMIGDRRVVCVQWGK